MANGRHPFVVFNPASGRGTGAKRQAEYLSLLRNLFPDVKHAVTTRPGEEAELAAATISLVMLDLRLLLS